MKPIYLKIAGLNSFREEQSIDFADLCSSGLFGIFGSTGSGKSTVLDAITLALYGKVERAREGTQGIINQNENGASVSFTFSLGQRKFVAERNYRRNATGAVHHRNSRLIEEVDGQLQVLAEGKREVDAQVTEILGLNVEDFTRAVVLPQGKFAEFLNLPPAERRRMLQRLFSLEEYGEKLNAKVRYRLKEVKNNLENLQGRQSELGDASPQVLKKAEERLEQEEVSLEKLLRKNEQMQKMDKEYQEIIKLQDELSITEDAHASLIKQKTTMDLMQEQYTEALKAKAVKPYLLRMQTEEEQLKLINRRKEIEQTELVVQSQIYEQAQSYWQVSQEKLLVEGSQLDLQLIKIEEAIKEEINLAQKQQAKEKMQKEFVLQSSKQKEFENMVGCLEEEKKDLQADKLKLITQIKSNNEQLSSRKRITEAREIWHSWQLAQESWLEAQEELKSREMQISLLSKEKEENIFQLQEIINHFDLLKSEWRKLEDTDLSLDDLQNREKELIKLDKLINSLQLYYQDLYQKQQDLGQNNNQIINLETNFNQYQGLLETFNFNKGNLEKQLHNLQEEYETIDRTNLACILRQNLTINMPCPVCGSLEHPHPVKQDNEHPDLQVIVKKIKTKEDEIQKLQRDIQNIQSQQNLLLGQKDTLKSLNDNLSTQIEAVFDQINILRKEIKEDWSQIDLKGLQKIYQQQRNQLTKLQEDWQMMTITKDGLIQKQTHLQTREAQIQTKYAAITARLDTNLEEKEAILKRLDSLSQVKREREERFQELADGLSGKEIEENYQHLQILNQEVEQLNVREREINTELDKIHTQLLDDHHQLLNAQQELNTLTYQITNISREIQESKNRIGIITGGGIALTIKNELIKRQADLTATFHQAQEELDRARQNYENQNNIYLKTQARAVEINKRFTESTKEFQLELVKQGLATEEQVVDFSRTEQEIEQLKSTLENYAQENMLVKQNIKRLVAALAGRKLTQEQWAKFTGYQEIIMNQYRIQQKLVYQLQDRLVILRENHLRWQQLEEQRKIEAKLADKLTQLESLFRGNAFVEFIAEEQLHNVAVDASQRLGELTQYKYALETDAAGGFVIRDDLNGGLHRSVNSLSGGETFLTSLALALALSGQIQLRGQYPLEFFFLDEGFGSLDHQLLETVIDALERLHSTQMSIGVISHVPELQARIDKKIIVQGAEIGGRGSTLM